MSLLDATGRPVNGTSTQQIARLEQALKMLAGRVNAQFNQTMYLGIFVEWITQQCEEQGINMNMEDFPAFAEAKHAEIQQQFASAQDTLQGAEALLPEPEDSLDNVVDLESALSEDD